MPPLPRVPPGRAGIPVPIRCAGTVADTRRWRHSSGCAIAGRVGSTKCPTQSAACSTMERWRCSPSSRQSTSSRPRLSREMLRSLSGTRCIRTVDTAASGWGAHHSRPFNAAIGAGEQPRLSAGRDTTSMPDWPCSCVRVQGALKPP